MILYGFSLIEKRLLKEFTEQKQYTEDWRNGGDVNEFVDQRSEYDYKEFFKTV